MFSYYFDQNDTYLHFIGYDKSVDLVFCIWQIMFQATNNPVNMGTTVYYLLDIVVSVNTVFGTMPNQPNLSDRK